MIWYSRNQKKVHNLKVNLRLRDHITITFWHLIFVRRWDKLFYFGNFQVVANLSKIYPKDLEAPAGGVDDMTKLSYLHEPGVLQNLKIRYELNEIYVSFMIDKVHVFTTWNVLLHTPLMLVIIADIYWKYSYCHQSIPKIASYLWCSHDATIQGSSVWRTKSSCFCSSWCCLQVFLIPY